MTERLPFIDWMKSLGMLVIIYGHAHAGGLIRFTQPFNPKQLGVAFFIFVLGFSLARETRTPARVLFNRLFDVVFYGLAAALIMSAILMIAKGNPAESNYLPLLFGVNVFFNFFPANTTTWYIGMYLHMLLFWALLARRWRVRPWMLVVSLAVEVVVRAAILSAGADFVAYMLFLNWVTVFLLGSWLGQQPGQGRQPRKGLALYLSAFAVLSVAWPRVARGLEAESDFPWSFFLVGGEDRSLIVTSLSISVLYIVHTWLVYEITSRLGDLAVVRFFSRNTLIVFIAHYPLIKYLTPHVYSVVEPIWLRIVVNVMLYFVGLSIFSELVRRAIPTWRLRDSWASRWAQAPSRA